MAASATKVGTNVSYKVTGNKLIVEIDLTQVADAPLPGKKMRQIANSGGFTELTNVDVDGQNVRLNLYAGVYPPR